MLSLPFTTSLVSRLLGRDATTTATAPRVTRWNALHVRRGGVQALPPTRRPVVLHCRSGTAWITHEGDQRDVVLQPSQSCTLTEEQCTRVYAVQGDCVLELQSAGDR